MSLPYSEISLLSIDNKNPRLCLFRQKQGFYFAMNNKIIQPGEHQQDIRLHMCRTRCRYLRRLHICRRPQRLRQQDILLHRNRKRCIHQKFYMPWKNTSLSCCFYCSSFGTKKQVVCQKIQIRVTFHPIFYRLDRSWARFHADVYRVR